MGEGVTQRYLDIGFGHACDMLLKRVEMNIPVATQQLLPQRLTAGPTPTTVLTLPPIYVLQFCRSSFYLLPCVLPIKRGLIFG